MSRVDREVVFVLHRRPFRDTSLVLDLFSAGHGRIGALGRAARNPKSPFFGLTEPFRPLQASWVRRGEMATLTGLEPAGSPVRLVARALWCGLYANELLMRLLQRDDPDPAIHQAYAELLPRLADAGDQASALRRFELSVLRALGVAPDLAVCGATGRKVKPDQVYRLDPALGPVPVEAGQPGIEGRVFCRLAAGETLQNADARAARGLMRQLIDHQLDGRPLKTPALFREN
ncbi:MAG: DNA repair protein RecO [Wenzhouxiangellaceae bacterium]|nr:DNA repair protein RecO [Wenzhouxiangellaceae bacterium]